MSNFSPLFKSSPTDYQPPDDRIPSEILSSDNSNIISANVIQVIHLRKVSVSNSTLLAFLSSEGVATHAAAGVDVTLLGH